MFMSHYATEVCKCPENTPDSSLKQEELSWQVSKLVLSGPYGDVEISGGSMPALLSLMTKLK